MGNCIQVFFKGTLVSRSIHFSYAHSMGNCWGRFVRKKNDDCQYEVQLASGNVHLITTMQSWEDKLSEANREEKIVIVNFCAAWCGPFRKIAPMYCDIADKYPSILFLTVDVDEITELSTSWAIKATPTFCFLKNGRQVDKLVGGNKPELLKKTAAVADLKLKLTVVHEQQRPSWTLAKASNSISPSRA